MTLPLLLSIWANSIVLALLAIAVVAWPLQRLLTDICGTRDRARFWTLYACVLLVAAPLLAVSTPGLLDASAGLGAVLQRAVFYSLLGIVAALVVMGYAVWKPVSAMAARRPEDQP